MHKINHLIKKFLLSTVFIFSSTPVFAQLAPDNTLGSEASRITINGSINNLNIDGGATRGSNLFHSFSQFNIGNGQSVYFSNPNGIENILTRVTGGQASNILGTLGVNGNANLFFMNPNGIFFGQNASLDIRGSFVGTTANTIQFAREGFFSATNPEAPPLLTINPSALLFNQINPQPIKLQQSILSVAPQQNLTLIGGNINLNRSFLGAEGGRVEIAAIKGAGTVGLNTDASLNIPIDLARASVNLENSLIDVTANSGGSIAINAGDLNIKRSTIQAGIASGLGTVESQAGDITLNTTGKLQISPQSEIVNNIFPNAIGKGGNIRINTDSLSFNGSGFISASTLGEGSAGNIVIKANNDINLNGNNIFSIIQEGGGGSAGNIDITTGKLSLTGGTWISASTLGQGSAGNVLINARESVSIDGVNSNLRPSAIRSIIVKGAVGQGGNITINTGSLSITNSGKIDTSVFGKGDAGNITVNARDTVSLDGVTQKLENGSAIFSSVEDEGIGNAGNININTGSLFVTNGGGLLSRTENLGNAGDITIQARDSVIVDGFVIQNIVNRGAEGSFVSVLPSEIRSSVDKNAKGNAGNIFITAGNNILLNPYATVTIGVNPDGTRNTGNINTELLSTLFPVRVEAKTSGEGNAGNITINAGNQLLMNNKAWLQTNTNGRGSAGNINIKAGNSVVLDNDAAIGSLVNNLGIGNGGDISVVTGSLKIANAAQIDTSTFGEGNAGNVIIDASDSVLFTGSKGNLSSGILSTAEGQGKGNGGNISINAASVMLADNASVATVTTKQGNAGNITIKTGNQTTLTTGAELRSSTIGRGNAGNITVESGSQVKLDDNVFILSTVNKDSIGVGGNIIIKAEELSISNRSGLNSSTFGKGNAGNISVDVGSQVILDKMSAIYSFVETTGIGNAGNIRLNTSVFSMGDSSVLKAATEGRGDSGNIFINASDKILLDNRAIISNIVGNVSFPGELGDGKGGNINIDTNLLSMKNGAQLQASTFGRGNAGDITINARDSIRASGTGTFDNGTLPTAAFSISADGARGNGGNIRVNTGSFFVEDGARFSVSTSGQGRAGNINIDAANTVLLDGVNQLGFTSNLSTATFDEANGVGGKITVNTNSFRVSNGASVNAQTTSAFSGGDVTINANNFEAIRGGRVITTATNRGEAGKIAINANRVNLSGFNRFRTSGLFANTDSNASGNGGSVQINTNSLNISDRAQISVDSEGSGVAGNININSQSVELSKRGNIVAETASQDGGNINIKNADLLLLRQQSLISATAASGGNGGNIDIDAKLIAAFPNENSDIRANAFLGKGGNVTITTDGLFGIVPVSFPTPKSNITASSQLGVQGQISINRPGVDPSRGLDELPTQVVDASNQIGQMCPRTYEAARNISQFYVTGRQGSLPPSPFQPLTGTPDRSRLATLEESSNITATKPIPNLLPTSQPQVVEAQGFMRTPDGKMHLVAEAQGITPSAATAVPGCP